MGWGGEGGAAGSRGRAGGASPLLPLGTRVGVGLARGSHMDQSAGIWGGGGLWDRHGNVPGELGAVSAWWGAGARPGSMGDTGCASQIDKKIVRTEIGVLLRLSHPNIVSRTPVTQLPPPSGWAPRLLGVGLPLSEPGAEGRAGMSLSSSRPGAGWRHHPMENPPCPPCPLPASLTASR